MELIIESEITCPHCGESFPLQIDTSQSEQSFIEDCTVCCRPINLSNLMAILLQALCARLGIATQRDLAQACRDHYSAPVSLALWVICELAICACDLAEVIGSAIALNLLFKIPLVFGVCITALDVLAVLYLQNKGFRYIEALVVMLILTIGGCFLFEVIFSKPEFQAVLGGFVPHSEIFSHRDMLYIGIGILGATVMPHNL